MPQVPGVDPRFSVAALVVSPTPEERRMLRTMFASWKWKWNGVSSVALARRWMERRGAPPVVICNRDLPDGDWKALFQQTEALARPPKFIVSARHADERLWVEVLNLGGHDVLSVPFDAHEVSHVVRSAARSWFGQWGCESMQPAGRAVRAAGQRE